MVDDWAQQMHGPMRSIQSSGNREHFADRQNQTAGGIILCGSDVRRTRNYIILTDGTVAHLGELI